MNPEIIAPTPPPEPPKTSLITKANLVKLFLLVLVLLLAGEIIWGLFTLSSKNSPMPQDQPREDPGSVISLDGPTTVAPGDQFKVTIKINSQDPISTLDLVVNYDPKILKPSPPVLGTSIKSTSLNKIDSKTGQITISGSNRTLNPESIGTTVLADITFQPLKPGSTVISVAFTRGSTTDSNIISAKSHRDTLSSVEDLTITIK